MIKYVVDVLQQEKKDKSKFLFIPFLLLKWWLTLDKQHFSLIV